MSVYERIAAVMADVTYLTRDCDMGDFWTLSDERVTSAVRASLIKNGLVIIPIATETQTKDAIAATITYRIQGIDDDGINVCMSGSGESWGPPSQTPTNICYCRFLISPTAWSRWARASGPKLAGGGHCSTR